MKPQERHALRFFGRTYEKDETIYFNWSLSGFVFRFHGTCAKARLLTSLGYHGASPENNATLWVSIDGDEAHRRLLTLDTAEGWYTLAERLTNEPHTIRVVKRVEVGYATAGIAELCLDGPLLEPPSARPRRIECIGDSFTCGDGCYTVGGKDAYVSANQDATMSYARLLGDYFDAEVHVIAKCGIGLVWNYAGNTAEDGAIALPQIYSYTDYFNEGSSLLWHFEDFPPDLILLNIGTNDASYIAKDRERWFTTYLTFLQSLQSYHPGTPILCTQGAVNCFSSETALAVLEERATAAGLTDIRFYPMMPDYDPVTDGCGVGMHPSPATHRKTAAQLIDIIERLGLLSEEPHRK